MSAQMLEESLLRVGTAWSVSTGMYGQWLKGQHKQWMSPPHRPPPLQWWVFAAYLRFASVGNSVVNFVSNYVPRQLGYRFCFSVYSFGGNRDDDRFSYCAAWRTFARRTGVDITKCAFGKPPANKFHGIPLLSGSSENTRQMKYFEDAIGTQEDTLKVPKCGWQMVVHKMQPSLHAIPWIPHWASRLWHTISARLVTTRCAPSRRLGSSGRYDYLIEAEARKQCPQANNFTPYHARETTYSYNNLKRVVFDYSSIGIIAYEGRCINAFLYHCCHWEYFDVLPILLYCDVLCLASMIMPDLTFFFFDNHPGFGCYSQWTGATINVVVLGWDAF